MPLAAGNPGANMFVTDRHARFMRPAHNRRMTPLARLPLTLLFACMLMLPATQAGAETRSFRCQNDLVNLGDNKALALLKCGKPLVQDSFCKPAGTLALLVPFAAASAPTRATTTVVAVGACETVDEWTYNPGRGQFLTTLRFESGRLASITYGDRVK